jgi:hypothetical protein
MEIKAILQKPYKEKERIDFIVQYNHGSGYTIEETETELQALGYTEEEIALQERERIAMLKLTKREVFLGLYQAKGVTPDMIKAQIKDPQALIEFEYANDYYRGNPLIDIVGATLGIKPEQLDCFFETKDYTCLLPVEEEEVIDDTNNSTTTDDTDVQVQPQIEDGLQEGETTDG